MTFTVRQNWSPCVRCLRILNSDRHSALQMIQSLRLTSSTLRRNRRNVWWISARSTTSLLPAFCLWDFVLIIRRWMVLTMCLLPRQSQDALLWKKRNPAEQGFIPSRSARSSRRTWSLLTVFMRSVTNKMNISGMQTMTRRHILHIAQRLIRSRTRVSDTSRFHWHISRWPWKRKGWIS